MSELGRQYFKYASLIFLSITLIFVIYYIARIIAGLDELYPIGQSLVTKEIPSPEKYPIYAKPISYIVVSAMFAWLFGLEALRERFSRVSIQWIRLFMIVAVFTLFISGYEMLWNFFMWAASTASLAKEGKITQSPDYLANEYPNPSFSVNFVFATKVFSLVFFSAFYLLIYLLTIIWSKRRI